MSTLKLLLYLNLRTGIKSLAIQRIKSNVSLNCKQVRFLMQSRQLLNVNIKHKYITAEDFVSVSNDDDYFGVEYYSSIRQMEHELAKEAWLRSAEKPNSQTQMKPLEQKHQSEPEILKRIGKNVDPPKNENIIVRNYGCIRYDKKKPDKDLEQGPKILRSEIKQKSGDMKILAEKIATSTARSNRFSRRGIRQSIRNLDQKPGFAETAEQVTALKRDGFSKQPQDFDESGKNGLSFIDDQYFNYDIENEHLYKVQKSVRHKVENEDTDKTLLRKDNPDTVNSIDNLNKKIEGEEENDLSYIDRQYFIKTSDATEPNFLVHKSKFGKTLQQGQTITEPLQKKKKTKYINKDTESEASVYTSQSHHGSDFIDEQYFGHKTELFHDEVKDVKEFNGEQGQKEIDTVYDNLQYVDSDIDASHPNREEKDIELRIATVRGSNTNALKLSEERQSSNLTKEMPKRKVNKKPQSAQEVAMQKRDELEQANEMRLFGKINAKKVDEQGFRILSGQVPDFTNVPSADIADVLRKNIIYNSNEIVAINKPYGLCSHRSPGLRVSIEHFLGDLLPSTKLHLVSGIGKETTGIVLLAKTPWMTKELQKALMEDDTIKRYLVVTKNAPKLLKGEINIPVGEGIVEGKVRKKLKPYGNSDIGISSKVSKNAERAVTRYQVLSQQEWCALLECWPLTHVKHQIRAHLAFGLNCPILGDHKYSHFDKIAPMKLPTNMLNQLHVRQSKVRHIAMHIHAREVIIPGFLDGHNLKISAPLPPHFIKNIKTLNLKLPPRK